MEKCLMQLNFDFEMAFPKNNGVVLLFVIIIGYKEENDGFMSLEKGFQ